MIQPIRNFIIVKPSAETTVTASGIILAAPIKRFAKEGTIFLVGPQCDLPITSGDRIVYEANAAYEFSYQGEKLLRLMPAHILATIEE